jgi:hypothetical protein
LHNMQKHAWAAPCWFVQPHLSPSFPSPCSLRLPRPAQATYAFPAHLLPLVYLVHYTEFFKPYFIAAPHSLHYLRQKRCVLLLHLVQVSSKALSFVYLFNFKIYLFWAI